LGRLEIRTAVGVLGRTTHGVKKFSIKREGLKRNKTPKKARGKKGRLPDEKGMTAIEETKRESQEPYEWGWVGTKSKRNHTKKRDKKGKYKGGS